MREELPVLGGVDPTKDTGPKTIEDQLAGDLTMMTTAAEEDQTIEELMMNMTTDAGRMTDEDRTEEVGTVGDVIVEDGEAEAVIADAVTAAEDLISLMTIITTTATPKKNRLWRLTKQMTIP